MSLESPVVVDTNQTLSSSDTVFYVDASGGSLNLTCPEITADGQHFIILRIDTSGNTVTLAANTGDTISEGASVDLAINTQYYFVSLDDDWIVTIQGSTTAGQGSTGPTGAGSSISIGAPIAATDNNALVLSGGVLRAEFADATHNGIMSTTTQAISGPKEWIDDGTFDSNIIFKKELDHVIYVADTTTANASGGSMTLNAAASVGSAKGGSVTLFGGTGGTTGRGGDIIIRGGTGGATSGSGGDVFIDGGSRARLATGATGGAVLIGISGSTSIITIGRFANDQPTNVKSVWLNVDSTVQPTAATLDEANIKILKFNNSSTASGGALIAGLSGSRVGFYQDRIDTSTGPFGDVFIKGAWNLNAGGRGGNVIINSGGSTSSGGIIDLYAGNPNTTGARITLNCTNAVASSSGGALLIDSGSSSGVIFINTVASAGNIGGVVIGSTSGLLTPTLQRTDISNNLIVCSHIAFGTPIMHSGSGQTMEIRAGTNVSNVGINASGFGESIKLIGGSGPLSNAGGVGGHLILEAGHATKNLSGTTDRRGGNVHIMGGRNAPNRDTQFVTGYPGYVMIQGGTGGYTGAPGGHVYLFGGQASNDSGTGGSIFIYSGTGGNVTGRSGDIVMECGPRGISGEGGDIYIGTNSKIGNQTERIFLGRSSFSGLTINGVTLDGVAPTNTQVLTATSTTTAGWRDASGGPTGPTGTNGQAGSQGDTGSTGPTGPSATSVTYFETSGTSSSGTPATLIAEFDAGVGNKMVSFTAIGNVAATANRQFKTIITFTDSSTVQSDSASNTATQVFVNAGGLIRSAAGGLVEFIEFTLDVRKVRFETLGSNSTGARVAIINGAYTSV